MEPENESTWLEEDDPDELQELLDPFSGADSEAYPISKAVIDPGNDRLDIVEPVDIGEQSGLGEF